MIISGQYLNREKGTLVPGTRLRARRSRQQAVASVIAVIVVAGATAVAKWPHAWWWLIVGTAAAAALVTPAVLAITSAAERRSDIARRIRAGLQGTIGNDGGRLPNVTHADLEARVHRAVLPIPYIPREEEEQIRQHLLAGSPVLIVGSSMVGKTRMAAKLIAEMFGFKSVIIPDSKTALASLDAADIPIEGTVVWLDDIDRLIGADGISDGAVRRLATANVIVATIRAAEYDRYRPTDQLRRPEWDVLSVFEPVFISRKLSAREQQSLVGLVKDLEIRERIRQIGIGEYTGAAGHISEALRLGAAGTGGIGYALVLGAANWQQSGINRPVPASLLTDLARGHLDARDHEKLKDQQSFQAGLEWATRDINPTVSLLQQAKDGFTVYDYALDLIAELTEGIPDGTWTVIIENAVGPELANVGYSAQYLYRNPDMALRVWRNAERSGDRAVVAYANLNLGDLLSEQGDTSGARAAYQHAIDSGDERWAPAAMVGLGDLLREQGDVPGARAAYQHAIDSGDAEIAASAWDRMGDLLREAGDVPGARAAYQNAIDSGHKTWAHIAVTRLRKMPKDRGAVD